MKDERRVVIFNTSRAASSNKIHGHNSCLKNISRESKHLE
jgi:hypothetical protein